MNTTTRTGTEAIDCTDCGIPHIVDYDTFAVSLAFDHDERSQTRVTHRPESPVLWEGHGGFCIPSWERVSAYPLPHGAKGTDRRQRER
jgi:hypothetical protein